MFYRLEICMLFLPFTTPPPLPSHSLSFIYVYTTLCSFYSVEYISVYSNIPANSVNQYIDYVVLLLEV